MNRDIEYIEQINKSINKIFNFTTDGKQAFMKSDINQDAVIRNIEIIGEISKKVI